MFPQRSYQIIGFIGLFAACSFSAAKEGDILFMDDFNRADAEVVGNGWITNGPASLKGKALHFQLDEGEFRPRARRTFPKPEGGSFKVSFLFDWLRNNEGSWSFYVQLGNGAEMPKSLIYERDLTQGIGVNLAWGGRDLVGGEEPGSFGYFKDRKFNKLFMANDSRTKETLVDNPVLTLEVDLDAGTYEVTFDGKTYRGLPLENKGPIDTIRFVATGCSKTGFLKSSIDDVVVVEGRQPVLATSTGEADEPATSDPEEVEKKPTGPRMQTSGELAGVDIKTFKEQVAPLMERHCVGCHGPDKQKARLRFDGVRGFQISDRHLWTMIHEQLSHGEMPPEDEPQPSSSDKAKALAWIVKEQRALGAGSTRRLNRREFGSALRDLTGLTVDFAYSIPGDGKVNGFDTGAEALQDAADSVNQIMEVTRRAVDGIRFLEPAPGKTLRADLVNVEKDPHKLFDSWKDAGVIPEKTPRMARPGLGALIEPKWPKDRSSGMFSVPPPSDGRGLVRVKFSVTSYCAFPEAPNPIAWVKIGGRMLDRREITGPMDFEYQVQVEDSIIGKKGLSIGFTPRVEIAYGVKGFENEDRSKPQDLPDGAGLFRPAWDKKKLRTPEEQPRPFVALKQVELEPDYVAVWPPAEWKVDLGDLGDNAKSAEKLLALWMERAYRRPVKATERNPFFTFYQKLRGDGMTFDVALRSTFQSVLMSSPFRYLNSTAHEDKAIADHAVASRLSFMLVGSPPDSELLELAASGKLRRPEVIKAQSDRLLNDPRSHDSFLRPFVTQWLEMEQPITLVDDRRGKASYHFRRYLGDSMREETFSYIARLFADDRLARELISSDWTMMNNTLARHYGYDGIKGGHLRKVKLRKDDKRGGGIMSHAGIQSMLTWMGDNWVIYRGAWTARHILDDPPQLPPLEVPELDATAGDNKHKTARELMIQHREDPKCNVCHTKLDPIGFAFQNFDLSGRWREVEHASYQVDELDGKIAWRGKGKTRSVDTVGELPGGEKYRSYHEFKKVLVKDYQRDMVRGLMKNFMLYATGRTPDVDDMAEIDEIMKRNAAKGYPLRRMLLAVFLTEAFLAH
tara:strand:- start:149 stop:3379 length:3231 start_codon:yes stop_codon:yes gene_type:complete